MADSKPEPTVASSADEIASPEKINVTEKPAESAANIIAASTGEPKETLTVVKEELDDISKYVEALYAQTKSSLQSVMSVTKENCDDPLEWGVLVFQLVSRLSKTVERTKISIVKSGKSIIHTLSGPEKKEVVIRLGKRVINDNTTLPANIKAMLLVAYDSQADNIVETIIDVSKNLNIGQVKDVITSCCLPILKLATN